MNDEVPNLRGGHATTIKWILGVLASGAAFFGGKVYEAGRWAERTESERMTAARDHIRLDDLEKANISTSKDVAQVRDDIKEIKLGIKDLAHDVAEQRQRRR